MNTARPGRRRYWLRETVSLLSGLCACMLPYLVLGGAAGFLVTRPNTEFPSCILFVTVFGLIKSSCQIRAVNMVWFPLVVLPRFLIVFPALALALLINTVKSHEISRLIDAGFLLLYSLPLAGILTVGVAYWRRAGRGKAAFVMLGLILLEIVALGLIE